MTGDYSHMCTILQKGVGIHRYISTSIPVNINIYNDLLDNINEVYKVMSKRTSRQKMEHKELF